MSLIAGIFFMKNVTSYLMLGAVIIFYYEPLCTYIILKETSFPHYKFQKLEY